MAQRQGQMRVDSAEVQGEGSFVVVRRVSYEMRQRATQMLAAANGGVVPREMAQVSERMMSAEYLAQNDQFTRALLEQYVVDWNWVDYAGKALPLPADMPGVIGQLTDEEVAFLARAINGGRTAAETKN